MRLSEKFAMLALALDRKSTRLNSSHVSISYAVFCLKKKSIARLPTPQRLTYAKEKETRTTSLKRVIAMLKNKSILSQYGVDSEALVGFFFFNDTATTEIYTLSLHDALPI